MVTGGVRLSSIRLTLGIATWITIIAMPTVTSIIRILDIQFVASEINLNIL
jgi:hypothetical protein